MTVRSQPTLSGATVRLRPTIGRLSWATGLTPSGSQGCRDLASQPLRMQSNARSIDRGVTAYVLDGDNIRFGLNRDLGFSAEDRTENIRRIGEVCRLFQDSGLVVLTAFISPYAADRDAVRAIHPEGRFIEVFVDTPLELCESRDVKGLYAKARAGEIPEFSGVSAPYEPPERPEIRVDTTLPLDECVRQIIETLDL